MPLIAGKDLFEFMQQHNKTDEIHSCQIDYKILLGLNHIHKLGVVHRDLKPENIMIDEEGDPKIIDFGLSRDMGAKGTDTRRVGSQYFMAPEIFQGYPQSSACDIWSVGIILYMMLSGSYPFSMREIEKEVTETPLLFLGPVWDEISP